MTEQERKVLWARKGVRATVVTDGRCMHTELTSRHALSSCYSRDVLFFFLLLLLLLYYRTQRFEYMFPKIK